MVTKDEILSQGRDVSNIRPPMPTATAVTAVQFRPPSVLGSIPSDQATAAARVVAATH